MKKRAKNKHDHDLLDVITCTRCTKTEDKKKLLTKSFLCCQQNHPWRPAGGRVDRGMLQIFPGVSCTFSKHKRVQEEDLCTHLHEQPLLPQLFVEDKNVRVGPDHVRVKVHDPKTLQAPSPRQGDVRLAALKHTCQRDFHTVQRHPLIKRQESRRQAPAAASPSCPPPPRKLRNMRRSWHRLGHWFQQCHYVDLKLLISYVWPSERDPSAPCCRQHGPARDSQLQIERRWRWCWPRPMNSVSQEGNLTALDPISECELWIKTRWGSHWRECGVIDEGCDWIERRWVAGGRTQRLEQD